MVSENPEKCGPEKNEKKTGFSIFFDTTRMVLFDDIKGKISLVEKKWFFPFFRFFPDHTFWVFPKPFFYRFFSYCRAGTVFVSFFFKNILKNENKMKKNGKTIFLFLLR